ncbi:hypothetical protein C1645_817385 [Glomus cerebriforme]|uniref:Uncharacterized protein n=1 Tax=Glomus cerebriforme TaxID=658196 RepID=A0A397T9H3_9GLOM|nr:hypothetical protein C1645_817385 [Glomus cerebriforme]
MEIGQASTVDTKDKLKPRITDNITIVKVEDSGEIFIRDGEFSSARDSFVFSFSGGRIKNYILSCMRVENKAIYNGDNYGPSFGQSDLDIFGNRDNRFL